MTCNCGKQESWSEWLTHKEREDRMERLRKERKRKSSLIRRIKRIEYRIVCFFNYLKPEPYDSDWDK